jgi:hypothetical protein
MSLVPIASLFIVLVFSLLVTRVAAIALTLTGMSTHSARFQARSAFTGVGFTTTEAESVVNHPVRRRVVMMLMLLGNVGIISAVSSLFLTFVDAGSEAQAWNVVILVAGVLIFWRIASSAFVDRRLSKLIRWVLKRSWHLDPRDYDRLLQLSHGFAVLEIAISDSDHFVADRSIADCRLPDEGVLVLAIRRSDGTFLGAPAGSTLMRRGDTLVVYGQRSALAELNTRRKTGEGQERRDAAVSRHRREVDEEAALDPEADGAGASEP